MREYCGEGVYQIKVLINDNDPLKEDKLNHQWIARKRDRKWTIEFYFFLSRNGIPAIPFLLFSISQLILSRISTFYNLKSMIRTLSIYWTTVSYLITCIHGQKTKPNQHAQFM